MAVRYPLVIDTTDNNKIKELPLNDSLNLSSNSIVNAVNITASGTLTVTNLVVDSNSVSINGNSIATVALTNSYTDLSNKPSLFDGQYSSLTGRPTIVSTTEDLADVSSTQATNGQALIYNSTSGVYEPGSIADAALDLTGQSISELADVAVISISTNQVLKWTGATFTNSNIAFSEVTGTPTTLSGYGITNAYTKAEVDAQISAPTGDLTGSVFGDNSTLLVDGVNSNIPKANIEDSANWDTAFAWGNHASAGYQVAGAPHDGDIEGSVFGDDSTLLVDGINNKIVGAVETASLRTSETVIVLGNNAQSNGGQSLSIGNTAISDSYGVAIGVQTQAASYDINVGAFSGKNHITTDNGYRVAVGAFAQQNANPGDETGTGAIAIGTLAGDANQGANAVAIGRYAGRNNQAAKSIVINATDSNLENTTADSLVIKPIRSAVGTTILMYDASSGEVTHTASPVITGDITGSVFGDDSTVLVDGVNSLIPSSVLSGNLPALDGSALTNLTIPAQTFASLTGKPTTLAGYGIIDAVDPSAETTFTADVKFDTGVEEKFATLTGSTGVTAMDCANGHVHYLTGASGDITANFTNLGLTAEYATNLTVIINQGATPYEVTAVQIGGAAQTIEWQGGVAPTGNANGIDSFSFTILNDGGAYVVLGQMVDFT